MYGMIQPTSWAATAQLVKRLATGWMVWESNPGKARSSAPVQTGPGSHPPATTMGNGSLSRRYSGRGVALTNYPHLAPKLKKA
jgi:hypothetical protein